MVIILLSIACVANSVSIILLWVSHFRGNRRGRGMTYADLKRSLEIQQKMADINHVGDKFVDYYRKAFGND